MNSIHRTHSAVVRLGFGTIIFLFFLPVVASSKTLEWEVVNPFHFIRDLDAVDELREKHKDLVR